MNATKIDRLRWIPFSECDLILGGKAAYVFNNALGTTRSTFEGRFAFILKPNSENCPQLKIRLVLRVGCLRECRRRYEPLVAPIRNVRTDEDISNFLVVAPIRKNEFVQKFDAHRQPRRNFVTRAQGLLELAGLLFKMSIFPFGFQGRVAIENPAPEILLRDQFRFRFEMSPSGGDFLVKRNADWIDHWVRQVVDRLDRAAVVMKTIIAAM